MPPTVQEIDPPNGRHHSGRSHGPVAHRKGMYGHNVRGDRHSKRKETS